MFLYLWKHRQKPPLLTKAWLKGWAKRVLTFPALVGSALRLCRLRARGASVGPGSMFAPSNVSSPRNLVVGENTFIGRVQMQAHERISIGSNVCVNDGVRLITATHDVRDPEWRQTAAPIEIGDFAWIATGAIILPGVKIGRGAVVGAGAVVSRHVPDFAVATGNPAKIRDNIRIKTFAYCPVRFLALSDAWLGRAKVETSKTNAE